MKNMLKNIKSYTYNGATILVIEIKNTDKPEPYNNCYYHREGTNTVKLNTSELINLAQELQKKNESSVSEQHK